MGKPRLPENSSLLICLLILVRISSSFYNIIYDCDETYNYWEIGHYLIYKVGYVTWEYSPLYALRSYFYIWSYLIPSFVLSFVVSNELILFYLTRVTIASFGVFCELYFCIGISRCAGTTVGRYSLAFSLISSGMYFASTAFLPNTLSMHLTMITFGAWFCDHYKRTIFAAGLAIFIGWPYVGIVYIPIALSMLLIKKNKMYFVILTLIYATIIIIPMIIVDSFYYGRFVIAPLNAILYNVFNKNGGPNLYGVESISYYPINLMLNFNLVFIASLASVPMLILSKIFMTTRKHKMLESSHITCTVSLLLWLIIFSLQAHKEERFMYPIYPLICASAALTVKLIEQFVVGPKRPYSSPVFKVIVHLCFLAFLSLSLSRVVSLHQGYRATFNVFSDLKNFDKTSGLKPLLNSSPVDNQQDFSIGPYINVCYGKEWYRYPNSFFLPDSRRFRMRFIRSSFRGQLPKLFEPGFKGMKTRNIYKDFNDMNREEVSRYIQPDRCHYLIDSSDVSSTSNEEPDYSSISDKWKIISSHKMLDLSRSPVIIRSFYIPYLSERQNTYVNFRLLRNDNLFVNDSSSFKS